MSNFDKRCLKQTKMKRVACYSNNFKSSIIAAGSTMLVLPQMLFYDRVTTWVVTCLFARSTGSRSCKALRLLL